MPPLDGLKVLNLGINAPPNVACRRLLELGATVTKVTPPTGDPDSLRAPAWYEELTDGQQVMQLDLKDAGDRARLDELLVEADVLVTSSRPAALERLDLAWSTLEPRYPRLVQVAIVGEADPRQHLAGHDLTYAAAVGLVRPPTLPSALVADLGGGERAVSTALALVVGRAAPNATRYAEVSLRDAAHFFAATIRHRITTDGGLLGGGSPFYGLYEAKEGWIALAALEAHFQGRLSDTLGLGSRPTAEALAAAFLTRTAPEWETFAEEHDLPLAAVALWDSDPLNDGGRVHPAAPTNRDEPKLSVAALELVEDGRYQTSVDGAGMTQHDGTTVDVDAIKLDADFALPGDDNGGQADPTQVDVANR